MEEKEITTTPGGQAPANLYDDGNIPKEDLPQSPPQSGQDNDASL